MMRLCGYEQPQRCHRVHLDGIRTRRLRRRLNAVCGCPGGILITLTVARHVQAGMIYSCRPCRQRLRFHQPIFAPARDEQVT